MLRVGITGGIGSGKSIVCKLFQLKGIPLFDADAAAKMLMETNQNIIDALKQTFGASVYKEGRINRPFLAKIVFNNAEKLAQLNAIVHPAVIEYGKAWHESQTSAYTIKEAALFFESGSDTEMDIMIGVDAPEWLRLQRAMKRDGVNAATIKSRMSMQMNNDEKMNRCDYVIQNNETESLILQVDYIHNLLIKQSLQRHGFIYR